MKSTDNCETVIIKVSYSPLVWNTLNTHFCKSWNLFIHLLTYLNIFTEFVLKFGKLLSREVKCLVQGHTTSL